MKKSDLNDKTKDVRVAKYAHHPKHHYQWFWFALGYLHAAMTLAVEYRNKGRYSSGLAAPLLFNFRHGIELFLKALALFEQIPHRDWHHHDIIELFQLAATTLAEADEPSLNRAAVRLDIQPMEIRTYLRAIAHFTEEIVLKHYDYNFLFQNSDRIIDDKNQLFRYPSLLTNGRILDPEDHADKLIGSNIEADIDRVSNFVLSFMILFSESDLLADTGTGHLDAKRDG